MRAEWAVVAALAVLPACGTVAVLTRPEGDGGWSPERRRVEVGRLAGRAGVALEPDAAVPPAAEGPLTLAVALDLAARRNRRIAMAGREAEMARARVRAARGRLLPATTASARFTRYTDALTTGVEIPGVALPGGVRPVVELREAEVGTVNGTTTFPLDYAGELLATLAAAQAGYRGEKARLWATTLAEQVAVIRAYFGLLEAERLHAVTEQRIAFDREQLANAEARFRLGRLTKNELLVVQVALRDAEQELVRRNLTVDETRWALNDAVGLAVDAPTEVADVARPPATPPVSEALRTAYAENPMLLALVEDQQRLDAEARALERRRLPRLGAGGTIDYNSSDIIQPQHLGAGFVGLTWDLGTDGRREAELTAARIAAERNRLAIEGELRALESAVRRTQRAVEERLAALAAAEVAVDQAEENLRIRRQQFDAGRATSEDVLDAEALLTAQRATLASALYQAHTRRAELQRLMGLPLEQAAADSR